MSFLFNKDSIFNPLAEVRNMKHLIFCLAMSALFFSSIASSSDLTNETGRSLEKVTCNDEIKICSYVTQNITARELYNKLNANLFPGSILSLNDGFINIESLKKLTFYFYNEEFRQRVIASISLFDSLEEFNPSDLILLTTEIYSLTEGGLSNLQASLVTANDPASELAEWVIASAFGGPTGIALKIGTNLLSSLLASSKVKEESSKITTISQLVPNLAGINYSNNSKVYISPPGSGVVKEEKAGLSVNGVVSVSSRDSDLVLIKDYELNYGIVENVPAGERVNILSLSNPQLYLVKGTSSIIVSSVTMDNINKTEYSAVSFGRKKEKLMNKIMIVTRAESVNFKDYVSQLKKLRQLELHKEFSKEEIELFHSSKVNMKDILNDLRLMTAYSSSGDRIVGFRLDSQKARKENYKKNIEVKIKSGLGMFSGIDQQVILPLETLMLNGLKFNPFSAKELRKKLVEIEITLREYKSSDFVKKKIYYNPENNKFIE